MNKKMDTCINFILPVALMAACAIEVAGGAGLSLSDQSNFLVKMAVNLLFFDLLHGAMTFIFLGHAKSGRQWLKEIFQENPSIVFRFFILATVFLILFGLKFFIPEYKEHFHIPILLLTSIMPTHHVVTQWYGLYKIQFSRGTDGSVRDPVRTLMSVFALVIGLRKFIIFMWVIYPASTFGTLPTVLIGVGAALVVAICYFVVRQSQDSRKKLLFLIPRMLIYLMMGSSLIATFATGTLHGIEAMNFYRGLIQAEEEKKKRLWIYIGYSGVLTFCMYGFLLNPYFEVGRSFFIVLPYLTTVHTYLHYYVESYLFKMQSPATRKNVVPLLKTAYGA